MMIPMVLGSMGMKRIVVRGQPLWLPSVLVASTGPAAVSLLFMFSAPPAGITRCRWSCFCRG